MHIRYSLIAALAAVVGTAAGAQTPVTVTPSNTQGWQTFVLGAGTAGISSTRPRNGNGSANISLPNADSDYSSHYIDFPSPVALSSLTRLEYDWIREGLSTTAAHLNPAFYLYLQPNGDATYEYLVYEACYSNGCAAVTTDAWVTDDLLLKNFWRSSDETGTAAGCGSAESYITLSAFDTFCYDDSAQILGIGFFLGNSIPGSFYGSVDNVIIANEEGGVAFNFEEDAMTPVPEPATLALMIPGVLALIPLARRRKRS